ncbi:hypothetical protein DMENIID0001_038860 [Sergentomyia squamirostris]
MGEYCENEWNLIKINGIESIKLIKIVRNGDLITCFLSDLMRLKSETLGKAELVARAKQRNPNLHPDEPKILDLICKTKASEYWLEDGDENRIHLKHFISKFAYRFTWNLQNASQEDFLKYFTAPLLCALKLSHEQREEREKLLKKKDEEITGFKLNGATSVRKNLETTPFDPKDFTSSQDFSFVQSQSVKDIYKLCGMDEVPENAFSNETKPATSSSLKTSPSTSNSTKTSPSTRSRIMNKILKKPKDEKLLYEEGGSSQEIEVDGVDGNDANSNDNDAYATQVPPPKAKKPRNILKL